MKVSTVRLHQLLLAAAILVPGIVLAVVAATTRSATLRDHAAELERADAVMSAQTRAVFETLELILDRVDDYAFGRPWSQIATPQTNRFLATLKAPLAQVAGIAILDADGMPRAGELPLEAPPRPTDGEYFAIHRARDVGLYISGPQPGGPSRPSVFVASRRRSTADGAFDGTVNVAVDPAQLERLYAQTAGPLRHQTLLLRADGIVLASEPGPVADGLLAQVLRTAAQAPRAELDWPDGNERHIAALRRVGDYPLYVVLAAEPGAVLAGWYAALTLYVAAAVSVAMALGALAALSLRRAQAASAALARLGEESARRHAMEERLRQSSKMEAMGQLTGGIAHDFNNHLAVVVGNLELIQRRLGRGELQVERLIDSAVAATGRAAALTHRLLAFSRRQEGPPGAVDINRLVAGMVDLLRRSLGERIAVETRLAEGVRPVAVDANQLENALLNLAVNARDAMPEGGRLSLETREGGPRLSSGPAVVITVRDTGSGMSPEVRARVFEPFFTTKEEGRGTGLGLSQVAGFVRQSGGDVQIDSEPGRGTAVHLVLPPAPSTTSVPVVEDAEAAVAVSGGSETLLVVEDDDGVRVATAAALRDLGYRVLEAADAGEALARLGSVPDLALMITDIVMPGTDGVELARKARQRRPDLAVLFTTGYDRGADGTGLAAPARERVLQKPVRLALLASLIRESLVERDRLWSGEARISA